MYFTLAAISVSSVNTSFSVVATATLTTVQCSHQLGVTLARQRLSALKYGCHFLTYTLSLTIVVQLAILLNYWIKSDRVISLSVWVVFTESACFYYMCRVCCIGGKSECSVSDLHCSMLTRRPRICCSVVVWAVDQHLPIARRFIPSTYQKRLRIQRCMHM